MSQDLKQYELIRWVVASPLVYTGSIAKDARWVITRYNTTTGVIDFARGSVDFATNWTGRAALSYVEYNVEF